MIHITRDEAPVITDQMTLHDASDASLIATIAAFGTTRDLSPAAPRAVLERRAAHAIMMGEEARNHRGHPKGAPLPDLSFVGLVRNLCEVTSKRCTPANTLRSTGAGTSNMQPGSERNAVLTWIAAQPGSTATLDSVDRHFNKPCRGHIQKLLATLHLERIT